MSGHGPQYRYAIEVYKRDPAEHLGSVPVAQDFGPALEWANFEAARKDPGRPVVLDAEQGEIEPRWDAKLGQPYLSGLRAIIAPDDRPATVLDLPLTYFNGLAKAASVGLVKAGKLQVGEVFAYLVCAYPAGEQSSAAGQSHQTTPAFSVRPAAVELAVGRRPLGELLARSTPQGPNDDGQMPVFIPRQVLDETISLMGLAGAMETGGILIGRLHRDGDLFLEVTAQIPAEEAQQELTRLTFNRETWTATDRAISLRGKGEMYVGWWHTHPSGHWCEKCPAETRRQCKIAGKLSGGFFSAHDVALHQAVFPRAYSVALVISDGCQEGAADGPAWWLYGWRYGMVLPRDFYVLGAAGSPGGAAAPVQQRGETDVANL